MAQTEVERLGEQRAWPVGDRDWRYEASTKTIRTDPGNHWVCSMSSWDGALDHEKNARVIAAAPAVLRAAEAMVSAFGGDAPDWIRDEFEALTAAIYFAQYGKRLAMPASGDGEGCATCTASTETRLLPCNECGA